MRVAILGIGSIGGVILAGLADTELELVAVSRGSTAQALSSEGLVIHTPEGVIESIPPDRYELVDSESGPLPDSVVGSCQAAIICGKAYSTPILSQIADEILSDEGVAISIQNGMGHAQQISSRLGISRTLGGATTHGAWRDKDGIHWVGRGSITMGSLDGESPDEITTSLMKALDDAVLSPIWTPDISKAIWQKLLINIAINPICSISGVRNGALLENDLWEQSQEILQESLSVAQASGINITGPEIQNLLIEVVEATSGNRCSMLQDLMAGRRTEIDSLCGYVIRMGESLGIPTPLNSMLRALVKGVEMSSHTD